MTNEQIFLLTFMGLTFGAVAICILSEVLKATKQSLIFNEHCDLYDEYLDLFLGDIKDRKIKKHLRRLLPAARANDRKIKKYHPHMAQLENIILNAIKNRG
ncbi:MAG: hypothetical protein Q8Q06_02855 [bacterium]|nr:hypothetical protein [bacterium]